MDSTKLIFKGTAVLVLYSLSAKFLSFLIELLIASKFGASMETDAYYLTYGIILSVFPMLSVGIWKVFMPEYKTCMVQGRNEHAKTLSDQLMVVFVGIALCITLFFNLAPRFVISCFAPGFNEQSIDLSVTILRILSFVFVFNTISTFPAAMLQARSLFSKSQVKEVVLFLFPLAYLILFAPNFGVEGLAVSVLIGVFVAMVWQYSLVLPYYRWNIPHKIFNKDTLGILKLYPVACLNAIINQLNNIIDKMFASTLGVGAVTYLNYGVRIIHLFDGLFSTAISVAIFPHLTEMWAKKDIKRLRSFLSKYITLLCAVLIPLSLLVLLLSNEIIDVLFGHGKFDEQSVATTSLVLFMYAPGLLAMGLTTVFNDILYIRKKIKALLYTTILNIACNIVLDFLLIKNFNVAGLSFATTISLYISLTLKMILMRDVLKVDKRMLKNIGFVLLSSAISFFVCKSLVGFEIISFAKYLQLIVVGMLFVLIYSSILFINSYYRNLCKQFVQPYLKKVFSRH